MFPAYTANRKNELPSDVSWLQFSSYTGAVGGNREAASESSDTDDDLVRALELKKAGLGEKNVQKRARSTSPDSQPEFRSRPEERKQKKHKKTEKKKKKKKKKERSRDRSADSSHLKRKWAFLEDFGSTKVPFVVDSRGDQSNKAFEQLPHTCAAVYKIPRRFKPLKEPKRYFRAKLFPPSINVAVNEKLKTLKMSSYISLGDALLEEPNDSEKPLWPSLIAEHGNLVNKCRSEPKNVRLWLKLCDFQKVFVPCSLAGSNIDALTLQKSILEKQLSVATEAISKNPIVLELRLKKFDLLCALDRQDELSREWDDVLRMSDYSIERQDIKNTVWMNYAQFSRSKFRVVAKFSMEDATAGYKRAIEAYRKTRADDEFLVDLIADYVDFLTECGHSEKAVAIYQALLDYNISQPGYLATEWNEDALKKNFGVFWDSGIARIGEDDHQGWRNFQNDSAAEQGDEIGSFADEDEIVSSEQPLNVKWAMLEILRQKKHWKPAKLNAEDVERIVLLDDIEMCLFRTRDKRCLRKLLSTFMKYLSRGDHSYLGQDAASAKMHQVLKLPLARVDLEGVTTTLYNCYKAGTIFLPEFPWADELLDRLLDLSPSSKDKVVVVGKKIVQIEANQANISLWTKVLKLLAFNGFRDEAITRGVKLLSMLTAGLENFQGDPLFFLATFLEIHLDVHCILATEFQENVVEMPDVKPLFSFWGALVQGKKVPLSEVDEQNVEYLYQYLTERRTEHSIEIACILLLALRGASAAYSYLCGAASQLSAQSYHRLNVLLHLLVNKHFSPSLKSLITTVKLACTESPTKEHLMLLAILSYKSPLSWRTCPIPQNDEELYWFAVLFFQLLRNQEYQDWLRQEEISYSRKPLGNVRRAMSQIGDVRNPLFWRLQAWAEIQAEERDRAKGTLLRGLQTCAWSKALFVDCALYFGDMLEHVVDSLTEKGLRLRTPLEEIQLLTETVNTIPVN